MNDDHFPWLLVCNIIACAFTAWCTTLVAGREEIKRRRAAKPINIWQQVFNLNEWITPIAFWAATIYQLIFP